MKKNFTPAYHFTESLRSLCNTQLKNILLKSFFAFACLLCFSRSMGQAGQALAFNGTEDNKVTLPFQLSGGSYTKEAWINASDLSNFPNILSGSNTTALYLNGGVLSSGHTFPFIEVQDNTPLVVGTWYHVAVSYDASSGLMTLYKNGVAVSSATVSGYVANSQYIGAIKLFGVFSSLNYFTGMIDEVRYWNTVRSQAEIAASMNCELTGDEPGLIAYYNFNQGIAGADNTGLSTLIDVMDKCVPLNGVLEGATGGTFDLIGTTSNWVAPGAPVGGTCSNFFSNIEVTGNSNCIVSGDVTPLLSDFTDFGVYLATPITRTFVIENTGNADLNISSITLANGTDFTVSVDPASVVAGGSSTSFQVTFNPSSCTGLKSDVVTINNDDGDEGVYTFAIAANCSAKALDFDGANDYVSLPLNFSGPLSFSGDYTKEAWINPTVTTGTPNILSGNSFSGTALYISNGQLAAGHPASFFADVLDPVALTPGWHHVAVTFNATTNAMNLYKDGVLVDSKISSAYSENLQDIGTFAGGNFFTGQIDEVRIWNTERSLADIVGDKDCELTGTEPGLIAYYHFNEGAAGADNTGVTSLNDVQDKCIPYNGTLHNFALSGPSSNWVSPGAPVCAAVTAPNIGVSGNSVCIANGDITPDVSDNTDFGFYAAPGNDRSFIIYNTGTKTLNISSFDITGADAIYFAILVLPAASVPPGGSTTFTIRFAPTVNGTRTATVVINNDDADEGTYTFDIMGDRSGPLPVSLLSFDGIIKGNAVRLTWKTTAELNNKGFEILRSKDGATGWNKIGFVASTNKATGDTYYFTDQAPFKGLNTYRLNQVDLNGNSLLSRIVALTFTFNGSIVSIYPNPVKDKFNLVFNDNSLINTEAKLRNSIGTLIYTINLNNFRNEIDLSSLPNGVYFLTLANGEVQRIIKL